MGILAILQKSAWTFHVNLNYVGYYKVAMILIKQILVKCLENSRIKNTKVASLKNECPVKHKQINQHIRKQWKIFVV